ncbi:hypothetical protein L1987_43202 [Smallanthus sonchifolius]|uniref:Uncharacterized protein n=1 Tax=Smallanthus sonchifolius TaxID=185202 RepID=A0ACB9GKX0_9ASTR|nr:hypothetical protein L1987_43202 [Smallanthus sonchifolius]
MKIKLDTSRKEIEFLTDCEKDLMCKLEDAHKQYEVDKEKLADLQATLEDEQKKLASDREVFDVDHKKFNDEKTLVEASVLEWKQHAKVDLGVACAPLDVALIGEDIPVIDEALTDDVQGSLKQDGSKD